MNWFVYALTDSRNNIRYVGKTNNPLKRLKEHINEAKRKHRDRRHLNHWIRLLLRKSQRPHIIVLEKFETEEACFEAERRQIAFYRKFGTKLCNHCDGGLGGKTGKQLKPRTKAHKLAISLAKIGKGHPHTPESRFKISLANKGKIRSYEQRLHESNSRKIFSDEEAAIIRQLRPTATTKQLIAIFGKGSKGAIYRITANRYKHPRQI